MRNTVQKRFRQTTAALVALTLVLSVLGPVGTVAAAPGVSVTQSANSTTVSPGDTVEIETEFSISELNAPQMSATTPSGWAIESQSAEGMPSYNGEGTWMWTAGDNDGINATLTVTYTVAVPDDATPGEYAISSHGSALTPADSSKVADSAQTIITVQEEQTNTQPAADAGDDQTVDEGTDVTLDASSSSDDDGDDLSYSWTQAGDGPAVQLSDDTAAQPTFTAPTVDSETTLAFEVSVSDGNGGSATDTVSVTVQPVNEQPTASISGPTSAQVGEDLSFDASASADSDGSIQSYEWDFDGDGTADASDESVSHTFSAAGDHTVELTVTDDEGATATATQTVSVSEAPDPASFQISNLNGPSSATQGDSETVSATIENTGDQEATQTVEFNFDGSVDQTQDVTLAGGASQTVEFTLDTTGVNAGTHSYGVSTDDDSATVQLTVEEPAPEPVDPGEVNVSVEPANASIAPGETTSFDIVVDSIDVGAVNLTMSLADGSVATIESIDTPAGNGSEDVSTDGQTVTVDAYSLQGAGQNGSTTVATVTVTGKSAGTTNLALDSVTVYDVQGNQYDTNIDDDAQLTVDFPALSDELAPPTNLDDDAVLEDVNGDGAFNSGDAGALFANRNTDLVKNNPAQFDFNGNGGVDIGDVQAAFFQAVLGGSA